MGISGVTRGVDGELLLAEGRRTTGVVIVVSGGTQALPVRVTGGAGDRSVGTGHVAEWRILLGLSEPGGVHFRHLRAAVSTWVEGDRPVAEHRRHVKHYTVSPLSFVEDGVWALRVTTLSSWAEESLVSSLDGQRAIRLGSGPSALVTQPERLTDSTTTDIAGQAPSARAITVRFHTPTVFRSGKRGQQPFPLPHLVLGHYRRRWNAICPASDHIELDLDEAGLEVSDFEGRSGVVSDGHRAGDRLVDRSFVGFTGVVRYRVTSRSVSVQRRVAALFGLAPYCGTGANTTIGMGVTSVLGYEETL